MKDLSLRHCGVYCCLLAVNCKQKLFIIDHTVAF